MVLHQVYCTKYDELEFEADVRFHSTFKPSICFVSNEPLQEKEDIEHPVREVDWLEFYPRKK